jgi:hypothetical protein
MTITHYDTYEDAQIAVTASIGSLYDPDKNIVALGRELRSHLKKTQPGLFDQVFTDGQWGRSITVVAKDESSAATLRPIVAEWLESRQGYRPEELDCMAVESMQGKWLLVARWYADVTWMDTTVRI